MESVKLEPITDIAWVELDELAEKRQHQLWAPTHVITKGGKVVGGVSINGVPIVNAFYGQGDMNGRDCVQATRLVKEEVLSNGWNDFLVSLGPESPMYGHAKKMGLVELGESFLHYCKINE